ncbi:MAG: hypothetical protein ACRDTU_08470 [Micromonosporaceae bacterium]
MTYDPGYGNQPYGNQPPGGQPPAFAPDRSPVPDVSQPVSGFPPAAPYGQPPMSGPPVSGPGVSGPPASPPYGGPMGYPAYPAGQVVARVDPGERPSLVTVAVVLTFLGIGLAFLGTVLLHLFWAEVLDTAGEGAPSEMTETFDSFSGALTFVAAGFNLLAGIGAAICAILAMRGSNGARITLCVLCGLFAGWKLMCGGYWTVNVTAPAEESLRPIESALPFMYGAAAIDGVLMLVGIAIVALLLTSPSNRYFNPPKVMATPRY